jgi:pimeloyl-ACP methyl ester carboxylesterase
MRCLCRLPVLIGAALYLGAACQPGTRSDEVAAAGENTALSVDMTPIHFKSQGQGDYALVLVHGWCTDMSYWDAQIPSFRVYYRVVTLDLAGHGRSGRNRKDWTMQAFGQDVAAVINKLDLSNVILVGHAMGGAAITEAARLVPERVIGLVGADSLSDIYLAAYTPEKIAPTLELFQDDFAEGVRQYVLENYFRSSSSARLKRRIVLDMAATPAEIGLGALEHLLKYDATNTLKQLSVPIRSINSDRPLVYFRVVRSHTENFRLKFQKNVGHFLMIENPEEFNRNLAEFLGQIIQASYGGNT